MTSAWACWNGGDRCPFRWGRVRWWALAVADVVLASDEAIDLLVLLEQLETVVDDVDLLFRIDGSIRILMDRIFPDLPGHEGRA